MTTHPAAMQGTGQGAHQAVTADQPSQHDERTGRTEHSDEMLPLGTVPTARGRRKSRHRVASRRERADRRAGVPVKPISLSVPASLAASWRSYSQACKRSLVDVMLDAIEANQGTLTTLVRDLQAAQRQSRMPVADGMFLRTPVPDDTAPEDPFLTISLRMLSTNVDRLDALSFETAAESRSQLVVAALAPYLATKRSSPTPAPIAGDEVPASQ